ncbi:hypothetical protein ACIBI9_59250 [Nonomuraea sp. NPDC050451]|uniref:hypothetical protein n=1 Tax=Nonomuraea sp. NPDC050451 TaxID=3364364 RepID=UPI0037ADDBBC
MQPFAALVGGVRGIREGSLRVWGLSAGVPQTSVAIPKAEVQLVEWLWSWRSIFRILAALRGDKDFLYAAWALSRWRVREVLAGRWSNKPVHNTDIVGAPGAPATFGQILTSEAAVAALMRWHINMPGRIYPPKQAEGVVQGAIREAADHAGVPTPTTAAALVASPIFADAVVAILADPNNDPGTIRADAAVAANVPGLGRVASADLLSPTASP